MKKFLLLCAMCSLFASLVSCGPVKKDDKKTTIEKANDVHNTAKDVKKITKDEKMK